VIFLFGYYFVINLAVVAVNFIQPWKILHQIAFLPLCLLVVQRLQSMQKLSSSTP
jgi:uncharacterized membrane protein